MILDLLYFVLTLGVIVCVHEFGHLIVAKRNGVYCYEFSIGMGPTLFKFYEDKTGTIYSIRALPLGGFVKMAGEDFDELPSDGVELRDDQLLSNKKPLAKIRVLLAGSFMNIVLAVFIFTLLGFFTGVDSNSSKLTINDDTLLAEAGLVTGDKIIKLNETEVNTFTEVSMWHEDYIYELHLLEEPLELDIDVTYLNQDDIEKTVNVTSIDQSLEILNYVEYYRPFKAIGHGFTSTVSLIGYIFLSLAFLFGPEFGINDLAGPVGIFQMTSSIADSGLVPAVMWVAFLSVNIGIVNLLPVPVLDGGRIVFAVYELIFRRKVNKKIEMYSLYIGAILLIGLTLVVTFNDITR